MKSQKFINTALKGLDSVGYRLEQYGITGKLNRHNLAAFIMLEQKHLEGEWDSLQAKFDRRRSQLDGLVDAIETRTAPLFKPLINRVNRFRGAPRS